MLQIILDTILVDSGNVLNFNTSNFITGANVVDGTLYFTDNLNEPRQVDIEYWRSQTSSSSGTSTGLTAERINVIKKSPQAAPGLTMSSSHNEISHIASDMIDWICEDVENDRVPEWTAEIYIKELKKIIKETE